VKQRLILLAVCFALLTCLIHVIPIAAGPDEKTDDLAMKVTSKFLKAIIAKDREGLMMVCDVPWYDDAARKIISKIDDLRKDWQKKLEKIDRSKSTFRIKEILTYEAARKTPDEQRVGKLLDQVLDKQDRVVMVELREGKERFQVTVLVRLRKGMAKVVGMMN